MKNERINLKSSVNQQGDKVTQIIHFKGGIKRTFHGILTKSISQGQFTKYVNNEGDMIMVNDQNVLCIEIFKEE